MQRSRPSGGVHVRRPGHGVERGGADGDTAARVRPAAGYCLRLVGSFGLSHAEHAVPVNPSVQRLLAFLATRTGQSTRSAASAALWPEFPDQRAAANLRSTLWRLRRDYAADLVLAGDGGVSLSPGVAVDVRQIHATVMTLSAGAGETDEPDPAALGQDVLPDWPEDWLIPVREWFRQVRLHALDAICDRRCQHGRFHAALEAGLLAVASEPLRESAHRAVAQVHLAEGNPAEALRQYHIYRRILHDELGLPPSPRFRRLVAPLLGRPLDNPA